MTETDRNRTRMARGRRRPAHVAAPAGSRLGQLSEGAMALAGRIQQVADRRRETSRAPLLLHTTLAIGLVAALAASLSRSDLQAASMMSQSQRQPIGGSLPGWPSSGRSGSGPTDRACRVTYQVRMQSRDQYLLSLQLTNTSSRSLNGWTLRWAFPNTVNLVYGWNAIISVGPDGAVATDIPQNQVLAPGQSTQFGFVARRGQWIPTPADFSLNGQPCG